MPHDLQSQIVQIYPIFGKFYPNEKIWANHDASLYYM